MRDVPADEVHRGVIARVAIVVVMLERARRVVRRESSRLLSVVALVVAVALLLRLRYGAFVGLCSMPRLSTWTCIVLPRKDLEYTLIRMAA